MKLSREFAAEFLGTALLLATVVGSGIMGERLAGGNTAIALLANAIATGAILVTLIVTFGPTSGAHLNPIVTLVEVLLHRCTWIKASWYLVAQVAGAVAGVVAAHMMFDLPWISTSEHVRTGPGQWWSEVVASFGLLTVILQVAKHRSPMVPVCVGCYITAAYWFTASTSFANPAVTLARSLTNTFSGVRPADAPEFILGQVIGALLALGLYRWMERPDGD